MTRKESHSKQEELWSRSFEDDEFVDVPYSRSAKKKAEKTISPITKTILIFGILILVLPAAAYFLWLNDENTKADNDSGKETEIVVSKNDTSYKKDSAKPENDSSEKETPDSSETTKEETADEEKETVKKEPVKEESKEQSNEQSTKEPAKSEPVNVPEKKPADTPKTETSAPETTEQPGTVGETYVVQPGDNLFRIALNHHMSTEELRELNGLQSTDIKVGDVLRVK